MSNPASGAAMQMFDFEGKAGGREILNLRVSANGLNGHGGIVEVGPPSAKMDRLPPAMASAIAILSSAKI
jgi:hypothetical protein